MAAMPPQVFVYRAKLVRVVDGDTQDYYLDFGCHSYRRERLRLLGVNAPEVHGATKPAGDAATTYTTDWLKLGVALEEWPLIVQTTSTDDFGRYLATVWRVSDGACLNESLVASGHAVPYFPHGGTPSLMQPIGPA